MNIEQRNKDFRMSMGLFEVRGLLFDVLFLLKSSFPGSSVLLFL